MNKSLSKLANITLYYLVLSNQYFYFSKHQIPVIFNGFKDPTPLHAIESNSYNFYGFISILLLINFVKK